MRISLELSSPHRLIRQPIDNGYAISSLIYHIISESSSEYARKLHQEGFVLNGKSFKLFTFSRLRPQKNRQWQFHNDGSMSISNSKLFLTLSSALDDLVEHLVIGLLNREKFRISGTPFRVESIKKLDPPHFSESMAFIMLTPLVCSATIPGKKTRTYLFPGDNEFERILTDNLCVKYELVHQKAFKNNAELIFELDPDFRASGKKLTKLVTQKYGQTDDIHIIGTLAPFRIKAPVELLRIGYECGFGQNNAQGFGMVKVDEHTSL